MRNYFTTRRLLANVLTMILLLTAGCSDGKADQHLSDYQLRKDVESTLSAWVFDACWAKAVPDTVIAVYHAEPGFGVAILKYNPSTGFSVLERNDQMIPTKGTSGTESGGSRI